MYALERALEKPSKGDVTLRRSLYGLVAEPGLLNAHTVSRERWMLEGRELCLRENMEVFKGGEQARIVGSCIRGRRSVAETIAGGDWGTYRPRR